MSKIFCYCFVNTKFVSFRLMFNRDYAATGIPGNLRIKKPSVPLLGVGALTGPGNKSQPPIFIFENWNVVVLTLSP
jgi:hypothetical protein